MTISKIDITETMIMLAVAICIDIIEVILTLFAVGAAVELVSGIVQYGIFGVWFYFHGTIFFTKKSTSVAPKPTPDAKTPSGGTPTLTKFQISFFQIVLFILESLPIIGALPFFTVSVLRKIVDVNKQVEEEEGEKKNENVLRVAKNPTPQGSNVLQFSTGTKQEDDTRMAA